MIKMENEDRERSRERVRRERPSRFSESSTRERSADRGKERGGMKSSNCRVYVSNIPYEYRWQDLKDLFRSQVGEVAFVELFVDENDKPRGCGIVEFSDALSVKKCLDSMHRFELKGRKMVIKEDFGNSRDKFGNLVGAKRRDNRDDNNRGGGDRRDDRRGFNDLMSQSQGMGNMHMGGGMGGGGGGNMLGNTFGLSPQFLEQLGIQSPLNTRIFVANLEYKVDKKKLKDVFRMAGKVQTVEMPLGKEGQSRGFAVIEYDHPVESVQAISMFHNQPLFDRAMAVRMDRGAERDKLPEGLKTIGPGLGTNGEPLKDVARNLPSLNSNQQNNGGPGILGAVPNLQLGNLNNLNNVSALSNLGSTSSVLQAANLAGGIGSLSNLANTLGTGDLTLAANLVQNNPQLAALAAASTSNLNNSNNFNRSDNNSSFMSNQAFQGNNNSSNLPSLARNYQSNFDSKPAFNFGGNDRDSRTGNNSNMFNNNMNNGNQQRNNASGGDRKPFNTKKIFISNLPPTASYKMVSDKCQEFGIIDDVKEQGAGNIIVSFQNEWEAERAIKNMDRARIDGRTIDVRFF